MFLFTESWPRVIPRIRFGKSRVWINLVLALTHLHTYLILLFYPPLLHSTASLDQGRMAKPQPAWVVTDLMAVLGMGQSTVLLSC